MTQPSRPHISTHSAPPTRTPLRTRPSPRPSAPCRLLAQMQQLAAWTRSCEISVAAAVHDCLDPQLLQPSKRHAVAAAEAMRAQWLKPE